MDREHWKKMLPFVAAFANGEIVEVLRHDQWHRISDDRHLFETIPELYRIAKPKERVSLEADDWIKDGPWWVRRDAVDVDVAMVVHVNVRTNTISIAMSSEISEFNEKIHMQWERRNATSNWMPCWKEKE